MMDGTIGGLILTCILLVYFLEELGMFFCLIAVIAYIGTHDDENKISKEAPQISESPTVLVEGVENTVGSRDNQQKYGSSQLSGLHSKDTDAKVRSDKGKEGRLPGSETADFLKVVESCEKTRHFKFVHNNIKYDISCGTAYKTKVK